jgi:hypothetical protein
VGLPSLSLRFRHRSRPLRAHATPVTQQPARAIHLMHLMCRSRQTAKTPTPAPARHARSTPRHHARRVQELAGARGLYNLSSDRHAQALHRAGAGAD